MFVVLRFPFQRNDGPAILRYREMRPCNCGVTSVYRDCSDARERSGCVMEKYETLGLLGEGSYGVVIKCRNRENGSIVAVKKFLGSEDDKVVKKIALREIKMLKQLQHDNLVNLLEVCRKKRRWYLVFEFVEHTILDDLEQHPGGLEYNKVRRYLFQILRGIAFCHQHNVIHRDIKPENVLVSQSGVVKLCDFGFARTMAAPGEIYTDYVATRWYRAPELLVGETKYGKAVDVWAVGCLFVEMLTGEPLFPGDSDIDQLHHIIRCFGHLTPKHQEVFYKNPIFTGVSLPEVTEKITLEQRFPKFSPVVSDLTKKCLQIDPDQRPLCSDLLHHDFFTKDGFAARFTQELNCKMQKDDKGSLFLPKMSKSKKREKEDFAVDDRDITCKKVTGRAPAEKEPNSEPTKVNAPPLIPPIANSPLVIITNGLNGSHGVGPSPGLGAVLLSVWSNDKTKKQMNGFHRLSQQSLYNGNLNGHGASEKSLIHERPFQVDWKGNVAKKTVENQRAEIHLPELKNVLLPELRGPESKQSKVVKKDPKQNCRIPSISAADLHSSGTA
ncbi:cyclin-dependent kinase-like 2 isoform X2 [Arapaima gigas]